MGKMQGKVVLITGGAMGMGQAHAHVFASEGAQVVLTDINEANGRETAAAVKQSSGSALFLRHDVTSASDWQAVVAECITRFGKVDVLVNNAGIFIPGTLEDTSDETWDRIMNINAKGTFLGCKHVLPAMQKTQGGAIINISSIYGLVGAPGAAAYEASKGAVRLLTKAAAADFAKFNIRVNSIHPGVIATEMTRTMLQTDESTRAVLGPTLMARAGQAQEVSKAVLFLASDDASYMTGSEMVVDGGYSSQ